MDIPFSHPTIDVVLSPGNASIRHEHLITAFLRLSRFETRDLNEAYRFARAEAGLADAHIRGHIEGNNPGAVQALLGLYACLAERPASEKFRFSENLKRGGHSFGFYVQSLLALEIGTFMTVASCARRGLAQCLPGFGRQDGIHAHLVNVRKCEDPSAMLKQLNGIAEAAHIALPNDMHAFYPAIRNVGNSVTFCSSMRLRPDLFSAPGLECTLFDQPPYHHPWYMAEAREIVFSFWKKHLPLEGSVSGVRMLSGMNGTLEEVGPNRLAIARRAADEICHPIDWTVVVDVFRTDAGEPDQHILSYGIDEQTGRKDPVYLVSGNKNAPGKWYHQAV